MDVDSIAPGADFVQKIEEAIDSSGVVLVLIGRDWVSRDQHEGLLDDPTDFIRLEFPNRCYRGADALRSDIEQRAQLDVH
jgi:hypothetical protein